MMRNQARTNSATQAQAILGAWQGGNIELFCRELHRAGDCVAENFESEEGERIELLRAIASDLRVPSIQSLPDEPGNVYGHLLRHLACSQKATRSAKPEQTLVQ